MVVHRYWFITISLILYTPVHAKSWTADSSVDFLVAAWVWCWHPDSDDCSNDGGSSLASRAGADIFGAWLGLI